MPCPKCNASDDLTEPQMPPGFVKDNGNRHCEFRSVAVFAPYIAIMARLPLDLPLNVAMAFVKDMRAYHAEPNAIKRDEIASRQLHALRGYQGPREKKLRVHDVKEMFEQIKNQA
jgi:hypothetical protein